LEFVVADVVSGVCFAFLLITSLPI